MLKSYLDNLKNRLPLSFVARKILIQRVKGVVFNCPHCHFEDVLIVNDKMASYFCLKCRAGGNYMHFIERMTNTFGDKSIEFLSELSAQKYYEEMPDYVSEMFK